MLTTTYTEYVKIIAGAYFRRWLKEGRMLSWAKNRPLLRVLEFMESSLLAPYGELLGEPFDSRNPWVEEDLARFGLRLEHSGESYDNVLKIASIVRRHPEVALFVQTNPAFCCPSAITEAMARDIERISGVPVASLTYDGTGTFRNDLIRPYLRYPRSSSSKRGGDL